MQNHNRKHPQERWWLVKRPETASRAPAKTERPCRLPLGLAMQATPRFSHCALAAWAGLVWASIEKVLRFTYSYNSLDELLNSLGAMK